jgi:hypothetical protein
MAITPGDNLNSTPAASQIALSTNYLDLNGYFNRLGTTIFTRSYGKRS